MVMREIDGSLFADMVLSGANHLSNNRHMVDDLNVFPVPDGDTGTNMSLTLQAAAADVTTSRDLGVGGVAKALAAATLRGARGNSGVIMSQLIRGLSKEFQGHDVCDAALMAKAFGHAAESAYNAVMKPTEGTILTVARALAESAAQYAPDTEDAVQLFEIILADGNQALERTPDMLPQLKQAGVVDAGGKGLMVFLEGALYALKNRAVIERQDQEASNPVHPGTGARPELAVDPEDIVFQYCTEFLIHKSHKNEDVFAFKSTIEMHGDCMVVIDDDDIIKVHIHTNEPNLVLGEALKLGELTKIKIDNMKEQHRNRLFAEEPQPEPAELKKYGIIAVAAGSGLKDTLLKLGVDRVIEGGQTMNPSTEDILNAVEGLHAEHIFVFPNNKNVILSAEQARNLTQKDMRVIPTRSVMQALTCLLAFDADVDAAENEEAMTEAMADVKTGQITYAVRDTKVNGQKIKKGDVLGLVEGDIVVADGTVEHALLQVLDQMVDDDAGVITLFYGSGVYEKDIAPMEKLVSERYPDTDVSVQNGGQPVYDYLISVE